MARAWLMAAVLAAASGLVPISASAEEKALNDSQKKGRQLFEQSCGVCHTKPTYTAPYYGPALSKESLSGDEEALLTVISNGTPRMPGFKHTYDATNIKAIISYLKTMSPPPPEREQTAPQRATRNVD